MEAMLIETSPPLMLIGLRDEPVRHLMHHGFRLGLHHRGGGRSQSLRPGFASEFFAGGWGISSSSLGIDPLVMQWSERKAGSAHGINLKARSNGLASQRPI